MDRPLESLLRDDSQFLARELNVELHSAELRKELSLPNLVFTQVLSIVGLRSRSGSSSHILSRIKS